MGSSKQQHVGGSVVVLREGTKRWAPIHSAPVTDKTRPGLHRPTQPQRFKRAVPHAAYYELAEVGHVSLLAVFWRDRGIAETAFFGGLGKGRQLLSFAIGWSLPPPN